MTTRLGVFLDWTVLDFFVLAVCVWQYISVSRDIKRSKARAAREPDDF